MSKNKTLAETNNNPLNIRYTPSNQRRGQTGQNKGFCTFRSPSYGIRAGYRILCNYIRNGIDTIEDIIRRWAPPSENDTERYINFVCAETMIHRIEKIRNETEHDYWTIIIILQAMAQMECGMKYDENLISQFINYPEKYE